MLGDSDREVTSEDIVRFKYLEMVLKETLRLFPPGAIFSRKTNENIKLGKCHEFDYQSVNVNNNYKKKKI